MFTLSKKSLKKLEGVHPDLVKVVKRAIEITEIDFAVIDGLRTYEQQVKYVKSGHSKTMNSRHLVQKGGFSCAVDLAAFVDGTISWNGKYYDKIAEAMFEAARELKIPIEWGGHWKTLVDKPHFQLPHKQYP